MSKNILASILAGLVLALAVPATVLAETVKDILAYDEAPAGVIFEIVTGDADALEHAIPAVQDHINALRARFPGLDVAVVSHGKEQFALTSDNKKKYDKVHRGIESLVKDAKVPVHVCETYASWHNIEASAFPDYVDVSPTGPAQVNDYLALDYVKVVID